MTQLRKKEEEFLQAFEIGISTYDPKLTNINYHHKPLITYTIQGDKTAFTGLIKSTQQLLDFWAGNMLTFQQDKFVTKEQFSNSLSQMEQALENNQLITELAQGGFKNTSIIPTNTLEYTIRNTNMIKLPKLARRDMQLIFNLQD
jgi:hypothetical protein